MSDDKKQKHLSLSKKGHQVLDAHPGSQSELVDDLLHQYVLTGDIEEAAQRVQTMRLEDLKYQLYEAYETTFSQFESHDIVATNPAVRAKARRCGLPVEAFIEVQKHLAWTVGSVTPDDVEALIDPSSDEAVINPTTVAEAANEVESDL